MEIYDDMSKKNAKKNTSVKSGYKGDPGSLSPERSEPTAGHRHIGKKDILAASAILLGTLLIILIINGLPYNRYTSGMTGAAVNYEIGKVVEVTSESLQDSEYQKGLMTGTQTLKVKLLGGKHRGETVTAENALSTYSSVVASVGKYLIVSVDELDSGEFQTRVYNYYRAPFIYLIGFIFFLALVLVGGRKGLMSGFGLIYTFLCVFAVFLPLVLRGYSPIWSTILLVIMVASVSMIFLNGVCRKSLCAVLGTICGVILSGIILFLFGTMTHLSGYSTEEAENLLLIGQTTGLKVRDLLFSGILIASLGAVMDTSVSIVSAISEFHLNMPHMKTASLFKAGMNVGKDMIGTMSNTLILAFTGTSINLLILLFSYSVQYNQLLNMNTITIEIIQAMSGSMGIILTVPLTAFITAKLFVKSE
ncbi:MAG: YibE/F family protein [Clostridia bacterium]|nr:YibE/F family protein [Clostridia bacterium]